MWSAAYKYYNAGDKSKVNMEQVDSMKHLFAEILQALLPAEGVKTRYHYLIKFLEFISEIQPSVPEEGSLDPRSWS